MKLNQINLYEIKSNVFTFTLTRFLFLPCHVSFLLHVYHVSCLLHFEVKTLYSLHFYLFNISGRKADIFGFNLESIDTFYN